ncbi:hypothetical protein JMJ35_003765 [Cladonia borealis]|uniref:DUF7730 domain-containing protein n=1 Tax=Cladonia borealis TaxID=184061 RepID=A0AA39R660_9LECA|nr:hypothetical protein JMJ35_003765 [Cladonia borealis]
MQETPSPPPNQQWQSLFFATLPPELRTLIYHELARDGPSVVHIMKKSTKQIDFVRCRAGKCEMEYNYKCCPLPCASSGTNRPNLPPFLLSCRKGNIEANPVLYSATIFDFRSFQTYLLASTLLPPHTFSSISSIHLKYHFGYRLWWEDPDNYVKRPWRDPVWNQVWDIIKGMEELRNVIVDIDAYLEYGKLSWETERDLFERLGTVKLRSGGERGFVVRVNWDGDGGEGPDEGLGRGTFRLVRGKVAEYW